MMSSNESISCITGPLWRESAAHWWIPLTKASDVELWCFLWSGPEQMFEQIIETPVIWDAIEMRSLWFHCNVMITHDIPVGGTLSVKLMGRLTGTRWLKILWVPKKGVKIVQIYGSKSFFSWYMQKKEEWVGFGGGGWEGGGGSKGGSKF